MIRSTFLLLLSALLAREAASAAEDACLPTLDFEKKPSGEATKAGELADGLWSDAGIEVYSLNPNKPAMLFDTANPTGGDTDLAHDDLGMVLIISEDGISANPDDNAGGGTLVFEFGKPVDIDSVGLFDLEEQGTLTLYDDDECCMFVDEDECTARIGEPIKMPTMEDGETERLSLKATGVGCMTVEFAGSGALTDIEFCPGYEEPTPEEPAPEKPAPGSCGPPALPHDCHFGTYSGNPQCVSGGSDMPFGFEYGWKMNGCQDGTYVLDTVPAGGGEIKGSCDAAANIQLEVTCNPDKTATLSWSGVGDSLLVVKMKGGNGGVLYNTPVLTGGTFHPLPGKAISHIEICIQCDHCGESEPKQLPPPEEPMPEEPAPEEPMPDEPAPQEPAPEEPMPDEPAPEEPAPEEPAPGSCGTPPALPPALSFGEYSGNPQCVSGGSDMPFGFEYGWKMNGCQDGTYVLDAVPAGGGEIKGACAAASNIHLIVTCNADKTATLSWSGVGDSLLVVKVKGGNGGEVYETMDESGGTFSALPGKAISHIEVCIQCDHCGEPAPEEPAPEEPAPEEPSPEGPSPEEPSPEEPSPEEPSPEEPLPEEPSPEEPSPEEPSPEEPSPEEPSPEEPSPEEPSPEEPSPEEPSPEEPSPEEPSPEEPSPEEPSPEEPSPEEPSPEEPSPEEPSPEEPSPEEPSPEEPSPEELSSESVEEPSPESVEEPLSSSEESPESSDEGVLEPEPEPYACANFDLGSESAWAYAEPTEGHCFLDDNMGSLGWTIAIDGTTSGEYEYDVKAGATDCASTNGVDVGRLTVTYDASTKMCAVAYSTRGTYTMMKFHFYCGSEKYPETPGGFYSTDPTYYSCGGNSAFISPVEAECIVDGVTPNNSGKIFVIAHSISCTSFAPDITAPPDPTPSPEECPEEMPDFNVDCTFKGDCPYLSETCCDGSTHPSIIMQCDDNGMTQGYNTDACLGITCDCGDEMTTCEDGSVVRRTGPDCEFECPDDIDDRSGPSPSPPKTGSGSGDPHFKTWTGDKFDYHGECDLVLVDNPRFHNGLGMRLHIRTKRVKFFSFIEKIALQVGNDILEFDNDVDNFLINGVQVEANRRAHKTFLGPLLVRRDKKAISVRVDKQHGKAKIDFHTRKNGFPAVIVDSGDTDLFEGSLGLLGEFGSGRKLARDGRTVIPATKYNATDFALEWQVRDYEPMLFKEARYPQFPTTCTPPAKRDADRLGSSNFRKEAEEACAHWKIDMEDCIFDVIATRDILVAEEGHIEHLVY